MEGKAPQGRNASIPMLRIAKSKSTRMSPTPAHHFRSATSQYSLHTCLEDPSQTTQNATKHNTNSSTETDLQVGSQKHKKSANNTAASADESRKRNLDAVQAAEHLPVPKEGDRCRGGKFDFDEHGGEEVGQVSGGVAVYELDAGADAGAVGLREGDERGDGCEMGFCQGQCGGELARGRGGGQTIAGGVWSILLEKKTP